MKILIGADLVPTESNAELFEKSDTKTLIGDELTSILEDSDFRIFNLEVPLTDKSKPIKKCGPCLIAPANTINGLKAINPDFFTLANNHILDQDEQGLFSTMDILKKNGIDFAGAGNNIKEASQAYIKNINGINIGIYCCAEHEFSIASDNSPGANPFDLLESFEHIAALKEKCDHVICLYHGGKEHYRYPSPYLQKVCRKIIDKGADIVVCQHSHCIGCKEEWNNGLIIYGQGNFLFDCSESEFWQTSLLLNIEIDEKTKNISHTYIPLMKKNNCVRLADGDKGKEILSDFEKRSKEIQTDGFIVQKYNELSESMILSYYNRFLGRLGKTIIVRALNKITKQKFTRWVYSEQFSLNILNVIDCEAHKELFLQNLK